MKLHENKPLLEGLVADAAEHPTKGGLGISRSDIEDDYWITTAMRAISQSPYADHIVFMDGNRISEAYCIGQTLFDNIDIAVINTNNLSNNDLQTITHSIEKIASEMPEQLSFKVSTFANPLPYKKIEIRSALYLYLSMVMRKNLIEEFNLNPFEINALDN